MMVAVASTIIHKAHGGILFLSRQNNHSTNDHQMLDDLYQKAIIMFDENVNTNQNNKGKNKNKRKVKKKTKAKRKTTKTTQSPQMHFILGLYGVMEMHFEDTLGLSTQYWTSVSSGLAQFLARRLLFWKTAVVCRVDQDLTTSMSRM